MNRPAPAHQLTTAALAVLLAAPAAVAQTPYTLEPPPEMYALIRQLRDPARRDGATAALAKTGKAAPYLRLERKVALDDAHKEALDDALAAVGERLARWNAGRARVWLKERRIDLCVEYLVDCDDRRALAFLDELEPVLHDVGRRGAKQLGIGFGGQRPAVILADRTVRSREFPHLRGDHVDVPKSLAPSRGVIRADTLDSYSNDPAGVFVAVRSRLRHPNDATNEWRNCIVLANCSIPLRAAEGSLIVSDGDVELESRHEIAESVVIARGDIRGRSGHSYSLFCAGGDITADLSGRRGESLLIAGGRVTFAGRSARMKSVRQKEPNALFGLRFVELAEFGVEAERFEGGVRVTKVAAWSPLATHEVRPGDVIRVVNEAEVTTPADLRRQLRRAVLLDYALLRVERERKPLTRIVFLDGLPTDPADRIAPPPRRSGRAR